jgi:hypothetical protein
MCNPRKARTHLKFRPVHLWRLSILFAALAGVTPSLSARQLRVEKFDEQVTVLPVTPDQWRNTLLGEVSRHDVLLAIQDQLTYPK